MILDNDIIKIGHETLRKIAAKVEYPISKEDMQSAKKMIKYLEVSQDDRKAEKYGIRAGVGLAAPQINVSKRFFAVLIDDGNEVIEFVVFNPEIVAESVQMTYLSTGEGCLSIPDGSGKVLRHKKIKAKGIYYYPKTKTFEECTKTFSGYPAIVFQHEYDHLNGVLFVDKVTNDVRNAEAL